MQFIQTLEAADLAALAIISDLDDDQLADALSRPIRKIKYSRRRAATVRASLPKSGLAGFAGFRSSQPALFAITANPAKTKDARRTNPENPIIPQILILTRRPPAQGVESEPVRWYYCVMIPEFRDNGRLPPGVHWASWDELSERFGWTPQRRALLSGLRAALDNLKQAGCRVAYVDGSFVTDKLLPNDYDACWEEDGVDAAALDPVLLTFDDYRVVQRSQYLGELFPASGIASPDGKKFSEFFQIEDATGIRKGIAAIDLRGLE